VHSHTLHPHRPTSCVLISLLVTNSANSLRELWTNCELLCMEMSLYSLCTDCWVNCVPLDGAVCLLNNCLATVSYVIARTVESSPWQRCRDVFTATLCSNQQPARLGPARPGSAQLDTARWRHRFDHPRYSILLLFTSKFSSIHLSAALSRKHLRTSNQKQEQSQSFFNRSSPPYPFPLKQLSQYFWVEGGGSSPRHWLCCWLGILPRMELGYPSIHGV
jgi:hypothetical protein